MGKGRKRKVRGGKRKGKKGKGRGGMKVATCLHQLLPAVDSRQSSLSQSSLSVLVCRALTISERFSNGLIS